jgi:uncharacterized protein YmfQ (DUF2313 family)
MLAPVYTAYDYLQQFVRLLPRGLVWQRGLGSVQSADLLTLMPTWSRLHQRGNDLITETFPCSTTEGLPEWEATLGLPDPCTGPLDTVQQRMAAVCAKFAARGGQSEAYFIALAERLGFVITIETFRPFYAGISRAGDPLYGPHWAHVWRVHASGTAVIWFRTSVSAAGEPLASWGNHVLECMLEAYRPAHTLPIFAYGSAGAWVPATMKDAA